MIYCQNVSLCAANTQPRLNASSSVAGFNNDDIVPRKIIAISKNYSWSARVIMIVNVLGAQNICGKALYNYYGQLSLLK